MSTVIDCPSKRRPRCQLFSMACSWGDGLAAITGTNSSAEHMEEDIETDGGVPTPTPHRSSQSVLFFFFYLGQKYSVLPKLPSWFWWQTFFITKQCWEITDPGFGAGSKSALSAVHNFATSSLAFLCPLHPLPQVCDSSSLTPISLLQRLLCLGSCFSFPPLLNLSFRPILQKFFQFPLCLLPHLLLPSLPSTKSQPPFPYRLWAPKWLKSENIIKVSATKSSSVIGSTRPNLAHVHLNPKHN